jgi:hypothetical protein
MKKIKVFDNASVMYNPKIESSGITITSNGKFIKDVEATQENKKKYIKKNAIIKPKKEE